MDGQARLVLETDGYRAELQVEDGAGRAHYRSELAARRSGPDESPPPTTLLLEEVAVVADGEISAAGWPRTGPWTPTADGRGLRADVASRPRVPLTTADRRALDALHRMTTMARGPVTAAALVPHVAPRWQAAAALLRRLVASGQARAVGRTVGRVQRTLYAPVGTEWAPEDLTSR